MAAKLQPVPPHGTRRRYQLRRDPCRCDECRRAQADWQAMYRARCRAAPGQIKLPRSWDPVAARS